MSDSNEKKPTPTNKKEEIKSLRAKKQEAEDTKQQKMYSLIGGLVLIGSLAAVIWNQGFFQRTDPAFTINGSDYNPALVQMFYTNELYQALYGNHQPAEDGMPYDYSTSAADQIYSGSPMTTWHDFFVQEAIESIAEIHLLNEEATAQGFTLSAQAQEELDATLAQVNVSWIGSAYNLESYLQMQYGSSMTEEAYLSLLKMESIANNFQTEYYENIQVSSAEKEAYYQENPNEMDLVTLSQISISRSIPATYDDEGTQIPYTEEELEAFTLLEVEAEALSQELKTVVETAIAEGTPLEEAVATYELEADITYSMSMLTTNYNTSTSYGEWILDASREIGDVFYEGSGEEGFANYSILVFEGRERLDELTSNIRHILIGGAESGVIPTEEEFAQAEATAQTLLDQFIADNGDSEAFGLLAQEHSADTGSAAYGGVIENVSTYSGFIEDFTAWCLDSSRKEGDTGLVKNTGSSTQGWHIMYFDGWGDPMWEVSANTAVIDQKMERWREELFENLSSQIILGEGTQDVIAVSLFG